MDAGPSICHIVFVLVVRILVLTSENQMRKSECHISLTNLWGFLLQCLQRQLYHLLVHLQRH
jgi:hypothetical protein